MKSFIRSVIMIDLLLLGLVACSGNITKQAVYTCTSMAGLIDVATAANEAGKVSPEQKLKIEAAIDKAAAVCENPVVPTSKTVQLAAVAEVAKAIQDAGVTP